MTYNFLFVDEILKRLTYCDKNKFCNEIFVNIDKLKKVLENEFSREIFLKNGLKDIKLPIKSIQYVIPTNSNYSMAIVTFEDKFVNRQLDSFMIAICIDKQQNFRVFALKQFFENEDNNNVKYFVLEQQLYQQPIPIKRLEIVLLEAFAFVVNDVLNQSSDDFDI